MTSGVVDTGCNFTAGVVDIGGNNFPEIYMYSQNSPDTVALKVHKIENFFDSDFGICVISLLVMHK